MTRAPESCERGRTKCVLYMLLTCVVLLFVKDRCYNMKLITELLLYILAYYRSWGSSVSTVSNYRLEDRAVRVRSPAGVKDFSCGLISGPALRPTQHPIQWVPEVLSSGVKRGGGVTLTTHPQFTAEVKNE
jgi:hypothetical protein